MNEILRKCATKLQKNRELSIDELSAWIVEWYDHVKDWEIIGIRDLGDTIVWYARNEFEVSWSRPYYEYYLEMKGLESLPEIMDEHILPWRVSDAR